MSDEDEQFQRRWGFRRNNSDVDSSSNDHSRPSSVSEPKPKKHKTATCLFPDQDDQKNTLSPESHPQGEHHSSDEGPIKTPNKSCKKPERKARTRKTDRKASDKETFPGGVLIDLSGHMESLLDGVKVARESLLKWMNDELEKSTKNDKVSQPAVLKRIQRRGSKVAHNTNTKRSTTPRSSPNKARRRSGTITQNPEVGSSDKSAKDKDSKTSHETSEVVVQANETAVKVASGSIPVDNNKKPKGKRAVASSKKQKGAASDQQTDNYLTLPAVLPRQEAENSERANSETGNNDNRDNRPRNVPMNQAMNFTPRSQQTDGMFAQNGLRNVSDFEKHVGSTIGNIRGTGNGNGNGNGNGSGSVFPFGLQSQGVNSGLGMSNFPSQFGLQYLSQESILSGLRMNGGHPILPNGNHGFSESYGAYNQQLRFKAQGGLMNLHSPDNIRPGNMQQPR